MYLRDICCMHSRIPFSGICGGIDAHITIFVLCASVFHARSSVTVFMHIELILMKLLSLQQKCCSVVRASAGSLIVIRMSIKDTPYL